MVGKKVILDTNDSYTGIVTKVRGNAVWIDDKITGFPPERWVIV